MVLSFEGRVIGMLAGVAIGDALGMPAEFLTPDRIQAWYGRIEGLVGPHPDHPHHRLGAGAVTDDTDHTVILARLLIEQGSIIPQEFASRLLSWAQTTRVQENHFVGPSTLKALADLEKGVPLDRISRSGVTVGAAMRVAPLAIVFADRDDLIKQVVASCSVSHYTRNAISGAMAMAFAFAAALQPGADPTSVALAAQEGAVIGREYGEWSWTPPIERRIDHVISWIRSGAFDEEAILTRLYELIGVDLYPEQLVPCAIGLVMLADGDPQRAVLCAANLGGDTDTLAAMAGGICGGLRGVSGLDEALLADVERINGLDFHALAERLIGARAMTQERAL